MRDMICCLVTETIFLECIFVFVGGVSGQRPTTAPSNATTTPSGVQTESSDNGRWLLIGIGAGAFLVLATVIGAAVAYVIHRNKKRVHPHSDTDSFTSETSMSESRPTTASHIGFEPDDEGMSRPVTMTPFELRKLFVETFPFGQWQAGYDGNLRPRMTLDFVDPKSYDKAKIDEARFREKIFHYEMTETIASRPPSSTAMSRMYTSEMSRMSTSILPPPSGLGPLTEEDGHKSEGNNSDSGNHSISDEQL